MRNFLGLGAALAASAFVMAACATKSEPAAATTKLSKTQWVAQSIAGDPVVENSRVTVVFGEPGKVAGSTGCNRYFGGYAEANEALTFSALGATKMACAQPLMDQETKFLAALGKAQTYAMDERGGLVIALADGRSIVLRPDGS
ncbi:MAG: META domain-containing protein [Hyphomonadaceae bacterium]